MIERIEKSLNTLRAQNDEMNKILSLTLTRLEERESAFAELIRYIDEIENQSPTEKKQDTQKRISKIAVSEGCLKAANRNIEACRSAIKLAQKDILSTVKEFGIGEVDDLIFDKIKKEERKGNKSQGLKGLQKSWAQFMHQFFKSQDIFKTADQKLNPQDIPPFPNLPNVIPKQYLV